MILLDDINKVLHYGDEQSISYDELYELWRDSVKTKGFHSLFNNLPRQIYIYDKIVEDLYAKQAELRRLSEP